jgi:uncharacterized protein YbjQ (UPF0145 family)
MTTGGDSMCGRAGCDRAGQPTTAKRCESCKYSTAAWSEAGAARLQDPETYVPRVRSPYRIGMPISTSNEIPGWEITGYIGEVFGLVVRSRGAFPQIGANLKSVFGGELHTMTNLLRDTRQQAIGRMVEEAEERGGDAVVAMRFDITSMGDGAGWTEVCAYGTAVTGHNRPVG